MIVDGAPIPWHQFVAAVQGDVGDASENVGELGLRIDVAEHEGGAPTPSSPPTRVDQLSPQPPISRCCDHRLDPPDIQVSSFSGLWRIMATPAR